MRQPGRDWLLTLTCVIVILAAIGYGGATMRACVLQSVAAEAERPRPGKLEQSAYTDASSAHITVTNLNLFTVENCVRGVVTPAGGGKPIESVPVCTGLMKPRTTAVLEAPYRVGAIAKECSSEPDRFGNTRLDWSRCTFEVESVH